ncbi:unnamed protein product [Haemonchus placei]|uniref:Uncharacterized protein n=1 Tax=Haemonchus placei TaxID=6290 RepID=A0A0N4WJ44_HAEPC|nr:unnamed protein product [Haemonchus placei]
MEINSYEIAQHQRQFTTAADKSPTRRVICRSPIRYVDDNTAASTPVNCGGRRWANGSIRDWTSSDIVAAVSPVRSLSVESHNDLRKKARKLPSKDIAQVVGGLFRNLPISSRIFL